MVLLLFAGLAIDVPIAMAERRDAQNAADHAALAAAYASCNDSTETESIAAGRTSASGNGYTNGAGGIVVAVTAESGPHVYKADIDSVSSAFFAKLIGYNEFGISVTAQAQCEQDVTDNYALYAVGSDCLKQIDVSGQSTVVVGSTHSNGNLYNGADPSSYGSLTLVDTLDGDKDPSYASLEEGVVTPEPPDPLASRYSVSDFEEGSTAMVSKVAADLYFKNTGSDPLVVNNPVDGGVYYSDHVAGIIFDPVDVDLNLSITLVSTGPIDFKTKTGSSWTAEVDGLLAMSSWVDSDHCSNVAIKMSDQGTTYEGIVYAPNALIEMSGSEGSTVNGSLVGWGIKLNGQDLRIESVQDPSSGDPVMSIIE